MTTPHMNCALINPHSPHDYKAGCGHLVRCDGESSARIVATLSPVAAGLVAVTKREAS